MRIEEYKLLCSCFDFLLKNQRTSSSRVAIEWLHFIRPHPVFIKRYNLLYRNFFLEILKKMLSYLLYAFKSLFFSLSSLSFPRYWFKCLPSADICFVSHLTDSSQLNIAKDPYFADLPSKLSDLGLSSVTVLINHTHLPDSQLPASPFNEKITFLDRLDFFTELNIFWTLLGTSCSLLWEAMLSSDLINFKICLVASIESFAPSSIANHRYAAQLQYLLSLTESKFLITTFEGFGWERFLFAKARIYNSDITCCGYQHSSIFPHHHSIGRSITPLYDPDILFLPGLYSLDLLSESSLCPNTSLTVIGSPKSQYNSSHPISHSKTDNCILVLPEGIKTEAELLLNFTISSALLMPDHNFIFRMHPVLPFSSLSSAFKSSSLPDNITISNNFFRDDLKHANYALFRGSTSIVEAINSYIVPIYLHMHAEISINPLHQYKGNLIQVSSPNDLSLLSGSSVLVNYDLEPLRDFVSSLFCPLSLSYVKSTLSHYG